MRTVLHTAPLVEPVSLELARLQCRLDAEGSPPSHTDDALLALYIAAAREQVEETCNLKLITQTWTGFLDLLPDNIAFPFGPVSAVTSVTYLDENGALQTLGSADYALDAVDPRRAPWLLPAFEVTWPATYDSANAVSVRFVVGYATAELVPPQLRAAILLLVADFYGKREPVPGEDVKRSVKRLTDPFMLYVEAQ